MCDACFSIDSFFSLCTQPTKVAQTIKASPQVAEPTSHGMPEMMMIAFITFKSSLVPLLEGL